MLIFAIVILIWVAGVWTSAPRSQRFAAIFLVIGAAAALHLVLPVGNRITAFLGGSAGLWLGCLVIGGVVWTYGQVLRRFRQQGEVLAEQPARPSQTFSETELNRYGRHIVLRELGGAGQKALKNARVLVVGAGGLGAPALQYLAAAGVGTIGVIDHDVVENTNLQRQVIHKDRAIGTPKVFSAAAEMRAQNPFIEVKPYHRRLSADIAPELFAEYDLVLDGTDNFDTRYLVNASAVAAGIPLISGALSQWEGQLSVFDPARGAPCYHCLFARAPADDLAPSCAAAGVLGPLPGVIGAMMAVEAVKIITGAGSVLCGEMVIYDALYGESRRIGVTRRKGCETCGHIAD